MIASRLPIIVASLLASLVLAGESYSAKHQSGNRLTSAMSIGWPPGTELLAFENVEGIILLEGALEGRFERDTIGPLALDTGAGFLALDLALARTLGLTDTTGTDEAVGLTRLPLPHMRLGDWTLDRLTPVLTVDGEVMRRVSDRPVLGLVGHRPLSDRVVWIDYREQVVAMIPGAPGTTPMDRASATDAAETGGARGSRDSSLARSRALLSVALSKRAIPVPFRLVGDGKILVHGAVADPVPPDYSRRLNLLVDTGATKCVLFEETLDPVVRHARAWPALRGLTAPTLIGTVPARIALVPAVEVEAANGRLREDDVDVGLIRSELSQVLARATGETIHGLIGYSFLKRFRVAVDYPNRVLWLDPIPNYRNDRPLEYCHVGLQFERQDGAVVVVGVVEGSPAARAGITFGDEVVSLDGASAREVDLIALTRRMEGQPGARLTLVVRRNAVERTFRLVRRRLL